MEWGCRYPCFEGLAFLTFLLCGVFAVVWGNGKGRKEIGR